VAKGLLVGADTVCFGVRFQTEYNLQLRRDIILMYVADLDVV